MQIERMCEHLQGAVRLFRPFVSWTIPIELNAVVVRIAQVERFAHAVVAGALQWNLGDDQATQRISEEPSGRVKNCGMVKACRARGRGRTAKALPCI